MFLLVNPLFGLIADQCVSDLTAPALGSASTRQTLAKVLPSGLPGSKSGLARADTAAVGAAAAAAVSTHAAANAHASDRRAAAIAVVAAVGAIASEGEGDLANSASARTGGASAAAAAAAVTKQRVSGSKRRLQDTEAGVEQATLSKRGATSGSRCCGGSGACQLKPPPGHGPSSAVSGRRAAASALKAPGGSASTALGPGGSRGGGSSVGAGGGCGGSGDGDDGGGGGLCRPLVSSTSDPGVQLLVAAIQSATRQVNGAISAMPAVSAGTPSIFIIEGQRAAWKPDDGSDSDVVIEEGPGSQQTPGKVRRTGEQQQKQRRRRQQQDVDQQTSDSFVQAAATAAAGADHNGLACREDSDGCIVIDDE